MYILTSICQISSNVPSSHSRSSCSSLQNISDFAGSFTFPFWVFFLTYVDLIVSSVRRPKTHFDSSSWIFIFSWSSEHDSFMWRLKSHVSPRFTSLNYSFNQLPVSTCGGQKWRAFPPRWWRVAALPPRSVWFKMWHSFSFCCFKQKKSSKKRKKNSNFLLSWSTIYILSETFCLKGVFELVIVFQLSTGRSAALAVKKGQFLLEDKQTNV